MLSIYYEKISECLNHKSNCSPKLINITPPVIIAFYYLFFRKTSALEIEERTGMKRLDNVSDFYILKLFNYKFVKFWFSSP